MSRAFATASSPGMPDAGLRSRPRIAQNENKAITYKVEVSYMEIYNEKVRFSVAQLMARCKTCLPRATRPLTCACESTTFWGPTSRGAVLLCVICRLFLKCGAEISLVASLYSPRRLSKLAVSGYETIATLMNAGNKVGHVACSC